jgi:anti-anti-sigma factor
MEISKRKEKDIVVISVKGRMDAVTSPAFEKDMSDLISKGEKTFVINLSKLDYISSAGLRSILASAKQLKEKQGKLLFAELQGPVNEVFKIAGFFSIFQAYETEEAAINQL